MLSMNEQMAPAQVPSPMMTTDDLHKRILKLRWIGMEDEAERLGRLLVQSKTIYGVWIAPRETD